MSIVQRSLLSLCALISLQAQAGLLDSTPVHYSVLSFGDYQQSHVDATGRVAVAGNMVVNGFGVGSALSGNAGDVLVVGGDLSFSNGQVNHGDIRVGGAASVQGFGLPNGKLYYDHAGVNAPPFWLAQQQVAGGGIASSFFALAQAEALATSSLLAATAANGAVAINAQGFVTLSGSAAGLNVFSLSAAQFAGASGQGLRISAPTGATVVVNVDGDGAALLAGNFGFFLEGGIDKQHIVYNFTDISTLQFSNLGVLGSVLAPTALWNGSYGNVDGDLVVAGVQGSTEFHNYEFLGQLPTAPVPEPASYALMAGGLLALAGWLRRRQA